jgi:predicted transcriptional regulator
MTNINQKFVEALDSLPEEMREHAIAYLLRQAEKFRMLKEQIAEGMSDIAAGRMLTWNLEEFLRRARRP